jgi:hypothetical protein
MCVSTSERGGGYPSLLWPLAVNPSSDLSQGNSTRAWGQWKLNRQYKNGPQSQPTATRILNIKPREHGVDE